MFNYKKCFLIFMILILLLFGITVVSATNNTDADTTVLDTNTITSTDTVYPTDNTNIITDRNESNNYDNSIDDTVETTKAVTKQVTKDRNTKTDSYKSVSSYTQLVEAVNNAKLSVTESGTFTINLLRGDYNATANFNWDASLRTKTLVIEGNGLVLNGNNQYRFITVSNHCTLKLNNITFTNFTASNGGVVYNLQGDVTVTNSKFINNNVSGSAGGAILNAADCNLIVTGSTFTGNLAEQGGAINNRGTLTVSDSTFNDNRAIGSNAMGSVLFNYENANCHITDSNFTSNSAATGGTICNYNGNLEVLRSTFNNNYAPYGAVIFDNGGSASLTGSSFNANNATKGGVLYNQNNGRVTISGSSFSTNFAVGEGSVLHIINGNVNITTSKFKNNKADSGAIYNNGNVFLTSSEFINNTGTNLGAAIYNVGMFNVTNSNFTSNRAATGAAIFNLQGTIDVKTSNFNSNIANSNSAGGAIINYNATATVTNSNFTNNQANSGGAIYCINSTLNVRGSKFTRNLGNTSGAAIGITNGEADINNSDFIGNNANFIGGAIFNNKGNVSVAGSSFKNNTVPSFGGAIFNNGTFSVSSSNFSNNTAKDGGAIVNYLGAVLNVTNSNFTKNSVSDGGGAIFTQDKLTISGSIFTNNNGGKGGGALYMDNNAVVSVTGSTFTGNIVSSKGGAIRNLDGSLTVTTSNFMNNTSENGSAIYNDEGNTNVTDSSFTSNKASNTGGSILNLRGNIIVNDSDFVNNTVTENGGAIINLMGNATIKGSTFTANRARYGGAVFFNTDSKSKVSSSKFENNNAEYGSGIFNNQNASSEVNTSSFINNTASNGGAAIYGNDGVKTFNSIFIGNTPENFILVDRIITLDRKDSFIPALGSISVYIDEDNTPAFTGQLLIDQLLGYRVPLGHKVCVTTNGFLPNRFDNNSFIIFSEITNYSELVQAVEAAKLLNSDSTLYLKAGNYNATASMTWGNCNGSARKLTIEGNGLVLDGKNTYRFMTVDEGYTLELKDITLTRYTASNGGAIYSTGNVKLTDSNFVKNNATGGNGAAIYNYNNANLTVIRTNFTDNTAATHGAAIFNHNGARANITSSRFINNIVNERGGAIHTKDNSITFVSDSFFINNKAESYGGAILNNIARTSISGSYFINNTVNGSGGAITNHQYGNTTVTDSQFTGNVAYEKGGAISNHNNGNINVTASTFINNTACVGGAIDTTSGSVKIISSEFRNNEAKQIANVTFNINGGAINNEATLNITRSEFIHNVASQNGGAIYQKVGSDYSITDSIFIDNTPKNFVKTSDNMLYLAKTDNYIPSNATINIEVGSSSVTKKMINNIVSDYTFPMGTYNLSINVNSNNQNIKVRNNTYIMAIDNNSLTLYSEDINCYYAETIPLTVLTRTKVSNAKVTVSISGNIIGSKVIDRVTDNIVVNMNTTNLCGVYTLNIRYNDTITGFEATTTSTLNITKKNTSIVLEPINDIKYNENVLIKGILQDKDGNNLTNQIVRLIIGDKEVSVTTENGLFEYNTIIKTLGKQTVRAIYGGTEEYQSSETNTSFTVNKQDVVVTYEDIADTKVGNNVTITGTFKDANGKAITNSNVRVFINTKKYLVKTDQTGTYILNEKVTRAGVNEVSVGYGGNNYYNSYETSTTFYATQDVVVTYEPIPNLKVGENVTITGRFTTDDGKAMTNSNVKIIINGKKYYAKSDSTGTYTFTTKVSRVGINNVTIGYSGNDKYNPYETSTTFYATQDVIVTVYPISDVALGENVTIAGKFTTDDGKAIANSNVKIIINGKKFYAKSDSTGTYVLITNATKVGKNNVTVGYSGNDKYNPYETNVTFNVGSQDVIITYSPINDVILGENVTITGRFTDTNGKAITNSNVKITIDGKKYYAKTDSTGTYIFSTQTIKEGVNNVIIGYSGSAKYNPFETSTTFTVLKSQ